MQRVLVTGGAGFIGSAFVRHLLCADTGLRIVVLDALTYAGNPANLAGLGSSGALRCVHGDIADRALVESLLHEERIDTVVNFAAESHVDRSIRDPGVFVSTNVGGTLALLEAARAVWRAEGESRRFHHVSTDEVYGSLGAHDAPFDEQSRYAPSSPYAASKAAADHLVRACGKTYGLAVTLSQSGNNYGPRQFPEKLIPLCIVHSLLGRTLPIYGDGAYRRGWLHVDDHCRALASALGRGRPGETYCFGATQEIDNVTLVTRLCAEIDRCFAADPALAARFPDAPAAHGRESATAIMRVADRPAHDRRYALDSGKARRELDYDPGRSLDRGLADTVRWYIDNDGWWRPVLDGSYRHAAFGA